MTAAPARPGWPPPWRAVAEPERLTRRIDTSNGHPTLALADRAMGRLRNRWWQVVVHRGVLPGEPDQPPHPGGVEGHVHPAHPGASGIRAQQRRQDAHGGGLSGTVGPENPQHGPRPGCQVHTVQGGRGPEAFHQPFGVYGVGHECPSPWSCRYRGKTAGPSRHTDATAMSADQKR